MAVGLSSKIDRGAKTVPDGIGGSLLVKDGDLSILRVWVIS